MTDIGKQLEQISQVLDWFTEARPLWIQASRNFALEASGEVHVFQVAERGVSLQSIWATIEYPTLLTNPRVTAIIYHVVMPDGNVITLP
ncbi:hypothetical protein ARMA_1159 [Ardenticatena maritima]|uniref:Uncharacterized protein n=2 Tax=Ardenticatena maritima TaxID=872965 RepID=A0A0M8K8Z7_9CHLR|nr:hypothetical protein ARMA_1159 [Ardenticatena maritima]